ncbi:MAG TPA: Ig-like domain-containing protein [Candidatus Saccharimonadales bacterium]|nr:Ig-like domain-containing protein [Candidatus Saccharimonadales bacterium]
MKAKTKKPVSSRSSKVTRSSAHKKTAHKQSWTKRLRWHHVGGMALFVIGLAWGTIVLVSSPPQTGSAEGCGVSSTLVNSCRPWLGAAVNNYPAAADNTKSQLLYHEQRIGRKLDIAHTYHPVGDNDLNETDAFFAKRDGTYLFANWKPVQKWRDGDGSNGTANANIDKMARSVKALGSKKIFMTLHHEPENDVAGGASGCSTYRGSAGTPTEYRAMWRNVQNRFKAAGATNVVWVMDYMNYERWDCMVDDLYPGNDLVDWVMFNGYGVGNDKFVTEVGRFYDLLTRTSNANQNYLSKPWGIVEWGIKDPSAAQGVSYFTQAKEALEKNTFPRLKAYMIFDARHKGAADGENYRVGYDGNGTSSSMQNAYNAFANHRRIVGEGLGTPQPLPTPTPTPTPSKDTVPPTITLSSPTEGSRQAGVITVKGNASDNVKVKAVTLRIDDKYVSTDESAPYEFKIDTRKYKEGKHSVVLRAWDPTDNMGQSKTVVILIDNLSTDKPNEQAAPPPTNRTTVVNANTFSAPQYPINVGSLVIVSPTINGSSIQVWINQKLLPNNVIETINLPNGTHTLTISENGEVSTKLISVKNPLPIAALNHVRFNATDYVVVMVIVFLVFALWFGRSYVLGLTSRREQAIARAQRTNYRRK